MAKHTKSKSLIRKQFAFAVSNPKSPQSQKIIKEVQKANRPELQKVAQLQKTKAQAPEKSKQAQLTKEKASELKTTKESEPFKNKTHHFMESDYERLRIWIEREGLDRDDAERKMQEAGQPMTEAQSQLLDDFEAEGVFGDVEVEEDYNLKRLRA